MDLKQYRDKIDGIDRQLIELFTERMKASAKIADYKKINNLPVLDEDREKELLEKIAQLSDGEYREYCLRLYERILEISRDYQQSLIDG